MATAFLHALTRLVAHRPDLSAKIVIPTGTVNASELALGGWYDREPRATQQRELRELLVLAHGVERHGLRQRLGGPCA